VPESSPISSNEPSSRGKSRPCSRCGAPSYAVQVRRPDLQNQMASHTAQNHASDSTPAEHECVRPVPGSKAAALGAWARRRADDCVQSESRRVTWQALAAHAEALDDGDVAITFFDQRQCFDPLDENRFAPERVPPLTDRNDFLQTIGALVPESGEVVMHALMRAVRAREGS
jgi:hypothetical protein